MYRKKVTHNNYQLQHLDTITPFFTMTHNQIWEPAHVNMKNLRTIFVWSSYALLKAKWWFYKESCLSLAGRRVSNRNFCRKCIAHCTLLQNLFLGRIYQTVLALSVAVSTLSQHAFNKNVNYSNTFMKHLSDLNMWLNFSSERNKRYYTISAQIPCSLTAYWLNLFGKQQARKLFHYEAVEIVVLPFKVYGSVHRKYIQIYIQQYTNLHSLFICGNCSTCFRWNHQRTSGAHTTVSAASGICNTVTAICRYSSR
jgi:hypothetical protein